MPRPDTSHWRQCDEDDCIVCRSRRLEFNRKGRALCRYYGLPTVRMDELKNGGDA